MAEEETSATKSSTSMGIDLGTTNSCVSVSLPISQMPSYEIDRTNSLRHETDAFCFVNLSRFGEMAKQKSLPMSMETLPLLRT